MISGDKKDLVPTASVGVKHTINYNWDLHSEYQRYQNMSDDIRSSMDANFFGLVFTYRFGSEPLIEEGIEAKHITYNGMGEENPIESDETENDREANRRVDIVISAFKYTKKEQQ
ncbi:hypothetical protein M445_12240 [Vibrio owensii 47666-1]|uniref:hypothetical protein n=1 Tax=Vibrio owensii TaxID=696485 RepID=UPI000585687B|nr:hypothetical protein [Vibrio owensii]KIF47750.1 hypothetical protein M445_12240 [Vibrio owensii 47666-1]